MGHCPPPVDDYVDNDDDDDDNHDHDHEFLKRPVRRKFSKDMFNKFRNIG